MGIVPQSNKQGKGEAGVEFFEDYAASGTWKYYQTCKEKFVTSG